MYPHARHPLTRPMRMKPSMHGDDTTFASNAAGISDTTAGDSGADGTYEPNYGAGSTGTSPDISMMSNFGPPAIDAGLNTGVQEGDVGVQYDPTALALLGDPYDPPYDRAPTARNYQPGFGFDDAYYSGFGPAAIIGCEVGCAGAGLKK